jgi:DNA-binding transcriptional LysR family regulator
MNLHQVRIFVTVARWMSFSAAARELFMTQPAVSLQVRALEKSLGIRLLDRSTSKLALTQAGEAFLPLAATMLQAEDEARELLADLRGASRGKLRIGTNTTGGMYLLPRILRAFRRAHPNVELLLDIDATDTICERVSEGVLELGFVGGPIQDRRLHVEPAAPDELVLIASLDSPLVQTEQVTLPLLAAQPLVVPEPRSRTRILLEQRLREAGLNVRPVLQLVGTEAVKKAVEANLGVAFVSAYAVEREVAHGYLRQLAVAQLRISRDLEIVRRARQDPSPTAVLLCEFVHAWVAEQLAGASASPT